MPIDYQKQLKTHGRILTLFLGACVIVGALIFLVAATGPRDLASASQQRPDARAGDQDRRDERDKRRPDHVVRSTLGP
jgi:hypothetical protein